MILLGTSSTIHILTMLFHYLMIYGKYKHYNIVQLNVISEKAMDNLHT